MTTYQELLDLAHDACADATDDLPDDLHVSINAALDALLSHPRELLAALAEQRVPCPTCGGSGYILDSVEEPHDCPYDCEDGTVPLDLVAVLCDLGVLEQVGWRGDHFPSRDRESSGLLHERRLDSCDAEPACVPVFARRSQEVHA